MGKPPCCCTSQQRNQRAWPGLPHVYSSCCRISLLTRTSLVTHTVVRPTSTYCDAGLSLWCAGAMHRQSGRAPRLQCSQLHPSLALQPLSSRLQLKGLHLAYHLLAKISRQHQCSMLMHQCDLQLMPVHTTVGHKAVSYRSRAFRCVRRCPSLSAALHSRHVRVFLPGVCLCVKMVVWQ